MQMRLPFLRFNSTMVRLKAGHTHYRAQLISSFNSTMVRLKAERISEERRLQDHKCFNSTMVRLKVRVSRRSTMEIPSVSIPQWFD